jgi:hypothetical protein
MDVTALVPYLAPLITTAAPHLLEAGQTALEKAGEKIAESIGEDSWKWGKAIVQKLWPKVSANPLAIAAAQEVAKAPNDQTNQQMLGLALQKLLEADTALVAEIKQILAEAKSAGVNLVQSGDRNVFSQGSGNTIITGDGNTVIS